MQVDGPTTGIIQREMVPEAQSREILTETPFEFGNLVVREFGEVGCLGRLERIPFEEIDQRDALLILGADVARMYLGGAEPMACQSGVLS